MTDAGVGNILTNQNSIFSILISATQTEIHPHPPEMTDLLIVANRYVVN